MLRSAVARIASCNRYSGSSKPGESVKMNCASPRVSSPTTGRRVDCGLGDTIARCSPTSAFKSVDLPTLGRPAKTTVPQRVMERKLHRRRGGKPPASARHGRRAGPGRRWSRCSDPWRPSGSGEKNEARLDESRRASDSEAGGGLLSHDLAVAVPSALTGLTTVFGMGTGVALSRRWYCDCEVVGE